MRVRATKLTYKILFQNVFFAIIPLSIFCVLLYVFIRQTFVSAETFRTYTEIENVSSEIEQLFSGVKKSLSYFSRSAVFRHEKEDQKLLMRALDQFRSASSCRLSDVMYKSKDLSISSSGKTDGSLFSHISKGEDRNFIASCIYINDKTKNDNIVLTYSFFKNKGSELFTLSAVLPMDEVWQAVNKHRIIKGKEFLIMDVSGNIYSYARDKRDVRISIPGKTLKKLRLKDKGAFIWNVMGQKQFSVYQTQKFEKAGDLNWTVIAIQPYESVFWLINYIRLFIFFSLLLLLLIVFIGSFYQTKKLTSSLVTFLDRIKEIRKGNLSVKTGIESDDEIGYLSVSFDRMTESLNFMKKRLEEKNEILKNINQELKKQLVNSERINLLGKISSGISHNMKNTVFLIKNYIRQGMQEKDMQKRESIMETADDALESIINTINPLLYFAKNAEDKKEMASLRSVLNDVLKIIVPYFEDNLIRLETHLRGAPAVKIVVLLVNPLIPAILPPS